MALANQADKKMAAGGLTSLDQQQYMSAKVTNQHHDASLININKSLTDLRDKLKILYDQLIRWRATAEFQVTDKENRVSEEEMRRKALKKAYSVFQAAKKIFRGDPVANQIYDQTLEYLAFAQHHLLGIPAFGRKSGLRPDHRGKSFWPPGTRRKPFSAPFSASLLR